MPRLADTQREFSHAVLSGDLPRADFSKGKVSAAAALQVHRSTVMGALTNTLRLSFPTVNILVGENFFDQAACAFVESRPPKAACLSGYGAGFAAFLRDYDPATSLPYLGDVAKLDWMVDRVLLEPLSARRFALDDAVSFELPASLTVLHLETPADLIKSSMDDDAALAAIDLTPTSRWLLVWRKGAQAAVRVASAEAGVFVASLLAGEGAEAALREAAGKLPAPNVFLVLQNEIFSADFCHVISAKDEST